MINIPINRQYRKAHEIDEDFFYQGDSLSLDDNKQAPHNQFLGKFLAAKRLNIFLALIFCGMAILLARTFWLQVVKGEYYGQLAEINRTREKVILANRGLIYDKNYKALVKNLPIFDALIMPRDLSFNEEKRQEQIQAISEILNVSASDIEAILKKYPVNFKYYLAVKENIPYEEAVALKIDASKLTGLYIQTRNQREYADPFVFSHLLGYLGKISEAELNNKNSQGAYLYNDYIGKSGLELFYEDSLRGKNGVENVEVDVMGQEKKVISYQEPQDGKNIVLSLDQEVQKKAYDILSEYLQKFNKKKGSLIMLNPQNGEILAMVDLPSFDNNLFAQGISNDDYQKLITNGDKPLFSRSIKGEYPSGSSIKPIVAAAALQEKVITDSTAFLSTGGLMISGQWFFPDWSASGHGLTNVYRAIAWSVNTFFYIVGGGYQGFQGLGIDRLAEYYRTFGLGSKTGIDLPDEADGLVPDPVWKMKVKNEEWYIGDTYHLAIGQGDLLVTPLQIANYTAFFANGGKLYQPHLVKEIDDNNGNKEIITPKIIKENFISPENIAIVAKGMRQTVTEGSAQYLNNLNVAVAGKTGTAQWNEFTHAWFTGFAPYDNPQVAITVLVEEGGEGSAVSVPIVHDMLNWYFNDYLVKSAQN